jgi:hypothetical protein
LKPLFREFVPELTLKENLMLPMTFMAVDEQVRESNIHKILEKNGLLEDANKYPRFLDGVESEKAMSLFNEVHTQYPNLETFLNLLKENAEAKSCLLFIQHELFMNIVNDLEKASEHITNNNYDKATRSLGKVVDRLSLRFTLGQIYDVPSVRILEVPLLVIKNYYNLLRYGEKANKDLFEAMKKSAAAHLNALMDSFIEISKKMK